MLYKLNDEWRDTNKAVQWTQDRGLLLGDGLFETLRIKQGKPLYLPHHWKRLEQSAATISLTLPFNQSDFRASIIDAISRNGLSEAGIRVTVTRGVGERGLVPRACQQGLSLFQPFDVPGRKDTMRLMYASIRRNETSPLTGIKSLSYLEPILIQQEARALGYDDALCLNTQGYITETSISNFFLIKDNTLITPPLRDGVLPGVMRAQILSHCRSAGIMVRESSILPEMITTKTSAFLTNVLISVKRINSIQSVQLAESALFETLSKHFDS